MAESLGPIPTDLVDFVVGGINSAFSGGIKGPNPQQEAALAAAGYTQRVQLPGGDVVSPDDPRVTGRPNRRNTVEVWIAPVTGAILGPTAARQMGRQLIRGGNINIGNAPPPGNNPPIPSSSAAWPYIVGSVYWGSKGPRRRRKVKRRKDYGGTPGGAVCGTDSQCEEWCEDHPALCRAREDAYRYRQSLPKGAEPLGTSPDYFQDRPTQARGPLPAPPIVRPDVIEVAAALPPWAKLLLGVFWPSELGDSDLPDGAIPQPLPIPKGPPRRPVIRPPVAPAFPPPDFQAPPRPRPPPIRKPRIRPRTERDTRVRLEEIRVTAQRIPEPARIPAPARPASPSPTKIPTPTTPKVPPWLSDPLALLLPGLLRQPQPARAPRPISLPLTPPQQAPLAYPLQLPTRVTADQCQCEQPKRKRKQCSNPVVRRTKRTRGGRRFVTTTRRIDCA